MFLFPTGLNVQIYTGALRRADNPPIVNVTPTPPEPKEEKPIIEVLKDIAPHMNRAQRRAKVSELAKKAKSEAAALAKKEIAKQQKEKARG